MNVFLAIGKGVEVAAKDAVEFFEKIGETAELVVSPRALIALSMLAVPLGEAIATSTAAASQEGLNIPLDIESARLIAALWPDFQAYVKSLAVQPPKGTLK